MEAHSVGDRIPSIQALLTARGFRHVRAVQPEFSKRVGLDNWQIYACRGAGYM